MSEEEQLEALHADYLHQVKLREKAEAVIEAYVQAIEWKSGPEDPYALVSFHPLFRAELARKQFEEAKVISDDDLLKMADAGECVSVGGLAARVRKKSQKAQVYVELTVHCTLRYDALPGDWSAEQIKAQAREDALAGLPRQAFMPAWVRDEHSGVLLYEADEHEVALCEIEEPDF